ncbi:MAG: rhodanese-like domain-containing protein [Cytophagales bacterium]|nr:rhodanese-like domain-containing protein [Cytophagales bacterium]
MTRFLLLILFATLFLLDMAGCQTKKYGEKLESLYNHTVPTISSRELAANLQSGKEYVILDIRSRKEFEISHLKNAMLIDYDTFTGANVQNVPCNSRIIVYCSVGYRSEKIGEKLLDLGFSNVKNLYGGIFQWKNDGYEVVNNNSVRTDSVHTYNRNWSQWLLNGERVY